MKDLILPILLLLSMAYFADTSSYNLAIPSAFQNPEAKKKIMDALELTKFQKIQHRESVLGKSRQQYGDRHAK